VKVSEAIQLARTIEHQAIYPREDLREDLQALMVLADEVEKLRKKVDQEELAALQYAGGGNRG
jgi:hypothetical protein